MKILHIIYDDVENLWCGGGGAVRARKINEQLVARNQVYVLTGNFPGAQNKTVNGIHYTRVGLNSSYVLSRISFTLGIPFYINRIQSDIIVNDISYFAPCYANLYTKRPSVHIVHHLMGKHAFKLYSVLGMLPFAAERIFLNTMDHIVTPSQAIRDKIRIRYPQKNVVDIPNGVSNKLSDLISEEEGFILYLGRIDIYMKGLDILLKAFANLKHRNVVLKIAGHGKKGDEKRIQQLIRALKIEDRVLLLGKLGEKDKFELLRTCLFLVMPSRFEGWGMVAVEANAAGKPVLGTRIKGLSEAVADGKTALLVEPENREQLIQAMDCLIDDTAMRAELGKAGRIRAKQYTWESIARQQFEFYQRVLNKNRRKFYKKASL